MLVILEDGASAPPSDVVSATTPVDPPEATVLQVTSRSQTTIDLAWNDVANESGYRIERSADGETEWAAIGTTGQDVTTYSDVGLEPHTTYFYRVVATNEGGSAQPSNVVSETTKNGAGTGGVIEGDGTGDGEPAVDGDATTLMTEPNADEDPAAPTSTRRRPRGRRLGSIRPMAAQNRERIAALLRSAPLIDGHNDLVWALRKARREGRDATTSAGPPRASTRISRGWSGEGCGGSSGRCTSRRTSPSTPR